MAVFAVLAGGTALCGSCILDIEGVLARGAAGDGGADAAGEVSGSNGAGTDVSTASSGGSGGAAPATTSSGAGGSAPGSLSCSPSLCGADPCVVDNGANSEASNHISSLVASDKYLFWTSQSANKLWRRAFDQSSATPFVDGAPSPSAIALNGTHVFWADNSGIWRCAVEESDCSKNKENLFTPKPPGGTGVTAKVSDLAATTDELYWTFDVSEASAGSVEHCSIMNKLSCKIPYPAVANSQSHPQRLVLKPETGDVVWTNGGSSAGFGSIVHWNKLKNMPHVLFSGLSFPKDLALSQVSGKLTLFWSELSLQPSSTQGGGVFVCQPDANYACSSFSTVASESAPSHANLPLDLAADNESLYWTSPSQGAVLTCKAPCLDGTMKMLADGQQNPHAIIVHAPSDCIFWADDTNGGRMLRRYRR